MIYNWKLATGHQISVDNEGAQTVITVVQASTERQQRTCNSFTTGIWIAPPTLTITATGGLVTITTPSGACTLQVDGDLIHIQRDCSSELQAEISSSSVFTSSTASPPPTIDVVLNTGATADLRRFCTGCGTSVKPTDNFCAGCGHKLR
jgi:hypothetical protein